MEPVKKFFMDYPQIAAAIITAFCGIIGILINIVINIQFRNKDYKNKNKIEQIEGMEEYYSPLYEKIENIIMCINNFSLIQEANFYNILDGKVDAKFASEVKTLRILLKDLYRHFNEEKYKILDNYKLMLIHRKVKKRIVELNHYLEGMTKIGKEQSTKEILDELNELIYRIKKYEIKLMIKHSVFRHIEYIKLLSKYKKNRIFFISS